MTKPCPCHSNLPYNQCCQPYHQGQLAPTPLALMRSRYAAYAVGHVSYIIRTEDPTSPGYQKNKVAWRQELNHFCRITTFVNLYILGTQMHSLHEGTVHFHAVLLQKGRDASFHENSLFVYKPKQGWLYVRPLP